MKQTHQSSQQITWEMNHLTHLLSLKKTLEEKVRVNLYIPKIVLQLLDMLAKHHSRGEVVTSLVIKEMQKKQKLPYGMFSPLEISPDEINDIAQQWEKITHEIG